MDQCSQIKYLHSTVHQGFQEMDALKSVCCKVYHISEMKEQLGKRSRSKRQQQGKSSHQMVLPPCPCCSAPNPASAQPSASLAQALHPKNDMYIIFQCTGFYVRLPHCIERSASYVWMGLHSCNAWIMQEKYCILVSNLFRSQNIVFFAKKKKSKSVKVISIKQTNKTKNFD